MRFSRRFIKISMMPYLVDKNSILNVIRNNPEYVRRIWIEKGFEGVSQDIIKELKRQGIPFKIILKDIGGSLNGE